MRFDLVVVLTVSSRGFLETRTGRGLWRTLCLISGRRVDRGGTTGGVEPFVKRDSGRRFDSGECASMLATVIIDDSVSCPGVGVEGSSSSGSGSWSGSVCSVMMGEKVNSILCGALGVTGVVVSSTVSGIS